MPLSDQRFRAILDTMLEGCQLIGTDWSYLYLNTVALEHARRPVSELIGRKMWEVYPGIETTPLFGYLRRCMEQRQAIQVENEFSYPDGSSAWFELRMRPVPEGVFVLSMDITERKKSEAASREANARYHKILEASFDAIAITVDGLMHEVNAGWLRLFGYENESEVIGRPALDFTPPEHRAALAARIATSAEGVYEAMGLRRDGHTILLEATARRLSIEGRPARITALRDVTEKRIMEAQFRQTQKLESVGRLAGGVAHDFNNLLTVITGHAEFLYGDLRETRHADDVRQIRRAVESASALTRQLLAFSRQQVTEPAVIDVGESICALERLLRRLIGEDVDLSVIRSDQPLPVFIDPTRLEQVVVNLAVNARDAMPRGGKLTIECGLTELDEEAARTHWNVPPGSYVSLFVTDTGVGMDAATRDKIFDPFFTTKALGEGTGLGLSIVYGAVQEAQGAVSVYTEPGMGATFKIFLPVAKGFAARHQKAPRAEKSLRGTETALLVEDSESVREVARRGLEHHGYTVLAPRSTIEALELIESPTVRFDIMVTDLIMPHMSGAALAARLPARHPNAAVLYMSGYTDDAVVRHGVLNAEVAYLQKPFTSTELVRKVRHVLDDRRAPKPEG